MQHHIKTVVVGLCGPRRSGKDTVAEHMVRCHGFTNLKLASRLKQALRFMFGLTDDHIEGDLKDALHPQLGTTPRRLMQWLGTDVMHVTSAGRLFWVKAIIEDIRQHHAGGCVVISDLRFHHEAHELKQAFPDCLLVRVERGSRGAMGPDDAHQSEVEAGELQGDTTITNNGTVEDLHQRVSALLSQMQGTSA